MIVLGIETDFSVQVPVSGMPNDQLSHFVSSASCFVLLPVQNIWTHSSQHRSGLHCKRTCQSSWQALPYRSNFYWHQKRYSDSLKSTVFGIDADCSLKVPVPGIPIVLPSQPGPRRTFMPRKNAIADAKTYVKMLMPRIWEIGTEIIAWVSLFLCPLARVFHQRGIVLPLSW